MATKDVCRLCGGQSGILINIFNATTPECLAQIEAVVPDVVILRNDSLSKVICHRCVAKVKEFFQFKQTCIQTQKRLKKALPWMSSSVINGGTMYLPRPASPTVTFMGGPLAFPFEVQDPEVEVLTLSDDEDPGEITKPSIPLASAPVKTQQQRRVPVGRVHPSSQASQRTTLPSNQSHLFSQPGTSSMRSGTQIPALTSNSTLGVTISPILSASDVYQRNLQPSINTGLQHSSSSANSVLLPVEKIQARTKPTGLNNERTMLKGVPRTTDTASLPSISNQPATSASPLMFKTAGPSASSEQDTAMNIEKSSELSSFVHSSVPVENHSRSSSVSHHPSNVHSFVPKPTDHISSTSCQSSSGGIAKNIRRTPYEKPKPKCKKQPYKLTESDVQRICDKFPNVNPVKINDKCLIFPCRVCNKILMTEEAISTHTCVAAGIIETACTKDRLTNQVKSKDSDTIVKQDEDSNDSTSSVEEVRSDDNISNRKPNPKHLCTVCGLQFLNFGRLQKHQISHLNDVT